MILVAFLIVNLNLYTVTAFKRINVIIYIYRYTYTSFNQLRYIEQYLEVGFFTDKTVFFYLILYKMAHYMVV